MATLSEAVPVSIDPSLCGVESGKDEDTVILSNKKSFIHILKLSDQKLICSLPVKVGVNISSPAVWSENKDEYIFVQNKREICSWKEGQAAHKIKKHSYFADIHRLFAVASYDPVVLCENGAVGFANAKEGSFEREFPESEHICWCWATPLNEGIGVVYTTSSCQNPGNVTVHYCRYDVQSNLWSHSASCLETSGTVLSCAAWACCTWNDVRIFTLWHDGALRQMLLHSSSAEPQGPPIFLKGVTSMCSLLCLSESYVAVVGLIKNGKDGVSIIDTKFGTVQAWQPLSDDYGKERRAFCHQEHILVHSGKALYLCRYECHQLALATMIGQHLGTLEDSDWKTLPVQSPFRKRTGSTSISGSPEKKKNKSEEPMQVDDANASPEEVVSILNNLADSNKTSSYSSFQHEFAQLKQKLSKREVWPFLNNLFLVLKRCCSETKFWPSEELAFLVSHQCITSSNLGMAFEAFSKKGDVSLIYKCLWMVKDDLPESCLGVALACFLSASEDTLKEAMDKNGLSLNKGNITKAYPVTEPGVTQVPFSEVRTVFIDEVLNCSSFDDVYLLDGLKKLPFTNALDLLKYILYKMKQVAAYDSTPKDIAERMLLLSRWKGIIIDAHATHLIMAKDAHELLVSFSQEEDVFVSFMNEAHKEVMGRIMLLEARKGKEHQKSVGSYAIEMLHLF